MTNNADHWATRHPQAALEGATHKELTIEEGQLTILQRPPVAEGVQITEYKSCQKEDEELLNKLEDQVKNPEIYGLFFNQCHQWTAKYLSKTGNPWNIGRDIVGGWKGPHPELKPKQNGQASQTNGHGASGTW